jgi:hypothetical protein
LSQKKNTDILLNQPVDEGTPMEVFIIEEAIKSIFLCIKEGVSCPERGSPFHNKREQNQPIQKYNSCVAFGIHDIASTK